MSFWKKISSAAVSQFSAYHLCSAKWTLRKYIPLKHRFVTLIIVQDPCYFNNTFVETAEVTSQQYFP